MQKVSMRKKCFISFEYHNEDDLNHILGNISEVVDVGSRLPWKNFRPKRWIKQLASLQHKLDENRIRNEKEAKEFIKKVEKWKEFEEREGIPM